MTKVRQRQKWPETMRVLKKRPKAGFTAVEFAAKLGVTRDVAWRRLDTLVKRGLARAEGPRGGKKVWRAVA